MEINLLLRLLIAHLLTDFILQPKSWVADREERQGKSPKLYIHVFLTAAVAYILSGLYTNWIIPVVIFCSHLLIDYLKSKTDKNRFTYFIIDQAAHIGVIIILWLSIEQKWQDLLPTVELLNNNVKFWIIATGYLFVSFPLGIIIGKATQKWRDQISREKTRTAMVNKEIPAAEPIAPLEESINPIEEPIEIIPEPIQREEEQELGLANAGKWIGICERVLILTFVLMGQYTAIGFLMTAKSILRFSEKETNTQLKTEYILVGTLVSFASSAIIGMIINMALLANP